MEPVALLQLVLILMAAAVVLAIAAGRLGIPPAVAFVAGGMVLAITPGVPAIRLDPALSLMLFVPPLLQSSAFSTPWRDFRANLRPILLLAVGAVLFTTAVVGVATKLLVPSLPWAACFTLGAIVSPPDAVSAGAVLERLRIPRRLLAVLEGESLVNDASSLVLYRLGIAVAMGGRFQAGGAAAEFMLVAVGGIFIGAVWGWAQVQAIRLLREVNLQITVAFLAAWGSFITADLLGVSGILATVTCGLVLGWYQHETFSPETRQQAQAAWGFVTFTMESLVFVLIGLSLHGITPLLGGFGMTSAVAAAITLVTIVSRFAWVFPSFYVPFWIARGVLRGRVAVASSVDARVPLAMSWAGMRGVVSLAAALALPETFPGRDTVILVAFAVIVGTVLLQATTLGPLIRRLGLARDGEDGSEEEARARAAMATAELRLIEERSRDELIGPVVRDLLDEYRYRADLNEDAPTAGAKRARMQTHLGIRLDALATARTEVLRLHRAGEIHDMVLRRLERELDLQDLRYRTTLRALA